MSHFDERSGVVYCKTGWGQWGQTIEEVFIEVDVAEGTKARDIRCDIKPKSISLAVSNEVLIQVLLIIVAVSCRQVLHLMRRYSLSVNCHRENCMGLCWWTTLYGR